MKYDVSEKEKWLAKIKKIVSYPKWHSYEFSRIVKY